MPDLHEFHEQVKRGDLAQVRAAVTADPSLLDATNASGQSAFLLAKYYHQDAVADYLLSLNPKLDLFNACVAGRTAEVLAEIDRAPKLLQSHSSDGWTPLHLAAFFGQLELAASLLDRGADVADQAELELAAPPEILRPDIDLCDLGLGRQELLVGEVGAQHQQHVASLHGRVP